MAGHTQSCLDWQEKHLQFVKKWPNHCKVCGASGVIHFSDSVDYGSTTVSMPGTDSCESCSGRCPRCHYEFAVEEYWDFVDKPLPCPRCGWNWGKNEGDLCPEIDCECWVELAEEEVEKDILDDWLGSNWKRV
jgi:hypothetical protein